jgi:hypothetical protein
MFSGCRRQAQPRPRVPRASEELAVPTLDIANGGALKLLRIGEIVEAKR